jgi:MarR family transcriptional regulator, organic hydroperoxide resistance regulator
LKSNDKSGRHTRKNVTETGEVAEVLKLLRRLFRAIHVYSKAIQAKAGLSGPQVWALTILESDPGLSARDLAAKMFVHPSTLTGIVERLVHKRAVERVVNRKDRRGVRLSVSPTGRRVLKTTPPPVQVGLTRALGSLPARRLRELRRSLERIAGETEVQRVRATSFDVEP